MDNYISKFDFEKATLTAPAYKGEFLDRMLSYKKKWPDDDTYLAYLNALFLELSIKVKICYHLHINATISRIGQQQQQHLQAALLQQQQQQLQQAKIQQQQLLQSTTTRARSASSGSEPPISISNNNPQTSPSIPPTSPVLPSAQSPRSYVNSSSPQYQLMQLYHQQHLQQHALHQQQQHHQQQPFLVTSPLGDVYSLSSLLEFVPDAPRFIFKKLGLVNSDILIAEFLLETIKEQQGEGLLNTGENVRLDLSPAVCLRKKK